MSTNNFTKVRVISFEQSGYRCFSGVMGASDLIRFTTVDRYDPSKSLEDPKQGYQRPEEKPRVKKFANFLRKNERPVAPTSVLLSSRGVDLHYNPETREIELRDSGKLQIVDGQHRIAGFSYAIDDKGLKQFSGFPIPFVILDKIEKIGEMKQFRIVNGEAKSVRTDLVNTILAQLSIQEGEDAIDEKDKWKVVATYVVDILNGEKNSVWFDRIAKPGVPKYSAPEIQSNPELEHSRLTRATSFVSSLWPVYNFLQGMGFLKGSLNQQANDLAGILDNFWNAIHKKSPEMFAKGNLYVIQKTAGVFSLHMILQSLLKDMYRGHREWTLKNFEEILEDLPSVTNSQYWYLGDERTDPGHATTFGGMKGYKNLSDLLLEEREDSMHSRVA